MSIYPQIQEFPIYNPQGRYWVKLMYQGKERKIEIDDTMPCTLQNEFIFPKTNKLEELWPALITKAILKLYSHQLKKFISFREIGEISIIYSLTGYIPEHLRFNNNNSNMKNMLALTTSEDYFMKQAKYLMCYNNHEEDKKSKENQIMEYKENKEYGNYNNDNDLDLNKNTSLEGQDENDLKNIFSNMFSKLGTLKGNSNNNIGGNKFSNKVNFNPFKSKYYKNKH